MSEIQDEITELKEIIKDFGAQLKELGIVMKGLTDWTKLILEGAAVEALHEAGVEIPESIDLVPFMRAWGTSPN